MTEEQKKMIENSREYRELMLSDPYRPAYHFAIPDDDGRPGDPNGAFYADGRYHLMYLYRRRSSNAFHWGHISSRDLLHWRAHPDAIGAFNGDEGCFSGGAFVDDDGTAYLTFWKFPAADGSDKGGIAIASSRPPYDEWNRDYPLILETKDGPWGTSVLDGVKLGCADPSNIWKKDGKYYVQLGSLCAMQAWGEKDENYRGDWVELFSSEDLKKWTYEGRFYQRRKDNSWTDETEDDMCPSFLPLPSKRSGGNASGKYLQLFIAHNKGAQYYIGDYKDNRFYPGIHGRMSWVDNTYFAPEALLDPNGRQIMWAWLLDNPAGDDFDRYAWSGVFSFPRELWLGEDGTLRMAPAKELDSLCYNPKIFEEGKVSGERKLDIKNGDAFRMSFFVDVADKAGVTVIQSADGKEYVRIYVDKEGGKLVFDSRTCAFDGRPALEEAPFELAAGEKAKFDVFVDKSVVEVYVNDRQAICRRVFSSDPKNSLGVSLWAEKEAEFSFVTAWEVDPTNLY
ncbi:MAG: glycoside hydrolase family 32 protein [Clostridia bacterium]|nr:glycoside hydrolase family 32 protein [Clostridia bacterium]